MQLYINGPCLGLCRQPYLPQPRLPSTTSAMILPCLSIRLPQGRFLRTGKEDSSATAVDVIECQVSLCGRSAISWAWHQTMINVCRTTVPNRTYSRPRRTVAAYASRLSNKRECGPRMVVCPNMKTAKPIQTLLHTRGVSTPWTRNIPGLVRGNSL